MERTPFTATTGLGHIAGWVAGHGPPVLALHGGPGLNFDYLDALVEEVAERYRVATFQQRGLAPSTADAEFTIAEAVGDIVVVLDELGWDSAYLMGHSWGGHLALHAAIAIPHRLSGVLAVDPLGAVGDGGSAEFTAQLVVRMPDANRPRFEELEAKESAEGLSLEEDAEQLGLVWPSYFAEPSTAPAMPPVKVSQASYEGLVADLNARLPRLEAALPAIELPVGVLIGERSPIPLTAGTDTADRIPGAWCSAAPGAGHFIWLEAPNAVLAAMARLTGRPAVPSGPSL
jgi:pimeloyl-ACP methyl ester carboxylesterase